MKRRILLLVLWPAAVVSSVACSGSGASDERVIGQETTTTSVSPVEAASRPVPLGATSGSVGRVAPPTSLAIPAIGVTTDLERLGLQPDGAIAPPVDFDRAGWFVGGPAPGAAGPAVIAGHVDSVDGPAVFARLSELRAGDRIVVESAEASVVEFVVRVVEQYQRDDFPVAAVHGPTPNAALRLITCGGDFDRDARHYRDNVVVFADRA